MDRRSTVSDSATPQVQACNPNANADELSANRIPFYNEHQEWLEAVCDSA
jgi:hypothetical protein